jgi:prepilin-type N-terminal cleavage/methylation domain-containing protein
LALPLLWFDVRLLRTISERKTQSTNTSAAKFTPQKKRKAKSDMNIKTSNKAGFTLVEIMIVVAIIGLLAAIAIPNFVRARATSQMNACINNLRQLDGAKQQFALENGKQSTYVVLAGDVMAYLGRGASGSISNMICPLDSAKALATSYDIKDVGTAPLCIPLPGTHKLN